MKKNIKWLISTISLILFLIIGLYLININDNIIDKTIYNLIISIKSNAITNIFKIITSLASVHFIIITCLIILLLKKLKHKRFLIIINTINDVILNNILKFLFKRERPIDLMLIEVTGYSFPSGHTMIATIFYGFIIYLINKSNYSKNIKLTINILLTVLIVLIGISRIYLGVHYASDVIASYLISISYLIVFIHFIEKYQNKEKNTKN